jgi:hypothetical protein
MDENNFQWIPWVLTVISWIVTLVVSFKVYKNTGKRTEINKLVDLIAQELHAIEDLSMEYWLDQSPNVYPYQLNLKLKRLIKYIRELEHLNDEFSYPASEIKNIRQAVTLDIEGTRPVLEYSLRSRDIASSIEDIYKLLKRQI